MRKFVPWVIGFAVFVLIGFVVFKPFKLQEPTDYQLTDYNLTDFENQGEECDEDYETYYTCSDGTEYLDCFCDEGKLDCLENPEELCDTSTTGSTETEHTGEITVSPNPVVVTAPVCFDNPCEIEGKFTITSTGPWYIDSTRDYATKTCGDAPGGTRWSICPISGGAGETEVIIKNRVYGVATPADYDTLLTDGAATWTFRLEDDWYVSAELDAYMELSKA